MSTERVMMKTLLESSDWKMMRYRSTLSILLLSLSLAAHAAAPPRWIGAWAASPLPVANASGKYGDPAGNGTTLRQIVHTTIGGSPVRVVFTNEFGTDSLTIGSAGIAASAGNGNLAPGTAAVLTFNGSPSVTIPAGALVVSDPANLKVAALSDLAVSMYLPDQTINQITRHPLANQTSYLAPGNVVTMAGMNNAREISTWDFLKGVQVEAPADSGSIVALGDSITDGAHTTKNANARWTDVLARRLQADKKTMDLSVLNEGISGNRLLHDGAGPNALARFDRDVLAQPGVRYLIVLEGINDIGHTTQPRGPGDPVTTQQLLLALQQIIERAHAHGIKVYGATLTPYKGAGYASPEGEAMRSAENDYIRNSGKFDGVIDFAKMTQDPAHPEMFLPAYDCGDHLHPNDAGYKAMGDGINLKLFEK